MELKEAKLQLLSLKKDRESFIQNDKDHDYIFLKDIEAIETVLQELENRIPKKKIEDKIEELKNIESKTCKKIFNSQRTYWTEIIEDILQELLEN